MKRDVQPVLHLFSIFFFHFSFLVDCVTPASSRVVEGWGWEERKGVKKKLIGNTFEIGFSAHQYQVLVFCKLVSCYLSALEGRSLQVLLLETCNCNFFVQFQLTAEESPHFLHSDGLHSDFLSSR